MVLPRKILQYQGVCQVVRLLDPAVHVIHFDISRFSRGYLSSGKVDSSDFLMLSFFRSFQAATHEDAYNYSAENNAIQDGTSSKYIADGGDTPAAWRFVGFSVCVCSVGRIKLHGS
jgi:hypothetical protein